MPRAGEGGTEDGPDATGPDDADRQPRGVLASIHAANLCLVCLSGSPRFRSGTQGRGVGVAVENSTVTIAMTDTIGA
ncbi:hypothetical protein GCM10011314_13610 [Knoellia flava]|uniref:Uncharacterized protein n=1 Tax=Knoellia flava TaxID=913969 RepID=A0A8H9FRH5_9MICO|nr:hypothetical protein GCM10011314_13610 [Knoellia flava]